MAYGFQVKNSSGNVIIDTTWPNPQAVETSTYSTVSRSTTYPSTGINSEDLVIARPIRVSQSELKVGIVVETTTPKWGSNYSITQPYPSSFAFYRLREGVATSTTSYGLIVYEPDGTTPIFNSNGVEKHFEVAVAYQNIDYNNLQNLTWFDIPSGDDINDYFCVLNGKSSYYVNDPFFGQLFISNEYKYDYTNNRIAAVFDNKQGPGIIGKII